MHPNAATDIDHPTDDTSDLARDETYAAWCDERRDASRDAFDAEQASL